MGRRPRLLRNLDLSRTEHSHNRDLNPSHPTTLPAAKSHCVRAGNEPSKMGYNDPQLRLLQGSAVKSGTNVGLESREYRTTST